MSGKKEFASVFPDIFLCVCVCMYVCLCLFGHMALRDCSSLTRDQTYASAVEGGRLNHWSARESPKCII